VADGHARVNDLLLGLLGAVGVLVGLVGTVVPGLPGLLLVFAVGTVSLLLQDASGSAWAVVGLLGVLAAGGTALSTVLPARRAVEDGAPSGSLALALAGAVVGFFVLPVLGLVVGGVLGLLVAEWRRIGALGPAWRSSRRVLGAYGIGVLLEVVVGCTMAAVWLATFVARAT
jgi:uncharacterized protein YqgC (DUF456 family)